MYIDCLIRLICTIGHYKHAHAHNYGSYNNNSNYVSIFLYTS